MIHNKTWIILPLLSLIIDENRTIEITIGWLNKTYSIQIITKDFKNENTNI